MKKIILYVLLVIVGSLGFGALAWHNYWRGSADDEMIIRRCINYYNGKIIPRFEQIDSTAY